MKSRVMCALGAVAILTVSACSSDGGGEGADSPIKIAASYDLSGPTAFLGKSGRDGASLAVKTINAGGGIDGRDLKLEVRDDKCDTATTVANVRRFAGDNDVVGLTGFACSPAALAAKPLVDQNKLPMMVSQATASEIHTPVGKYTWMSNVPADIESGALTESVVKNLSPSRIAVVEVANAYGKSSGAGVEKWLDDNGKGDLLVGRIEIPIGATDFGVQMRELKKLNADVTMIVAYDMPPVIKTAKQIGVETQWVSFSGGVLKSSVESLAQAGSLKGFVSSAMWPSLIASDSSSPQMAEFATKFEAEYGEWPDNGNLEGYAGVMLLAEAMKLGGSDVTRASIQNALETKMSNVDLGLYYPYSFSAKSHAGAKKVTVITYGSNDVPGPNGLYGDAKLATE